ncbi:hypothetical protein EW026_g6220 [Hermanssonia centrifuga]|uniref:Uncharacterized protein n=1 Tax=Hermanssonia centrifuga TaxID=98765 RepID=A0A4S4KG24_9APHY|nr:hypothetical protein EW026_g6220 [Hermanssonia centrifuga]
MTNHIGLFNFDCRSNTSRDALPHASTPVDGPQNAVPEAPLGKKRKIGRTPQLDTPTPFRLSTPLPEERAARPLDADEDNPFIARETDPTSTQSTFRLRLNPLIANPTRSAAQVPTPQFTSILGYTAKPIAGWPTVHFTHPLGLFDNIDNSQFLDWKNFQDNQGPPLLAQLFDHGAPAENAAKTMTDRIKFAIKCLTGYDAARISPPTAMYPPPRNSDGNTKAAPHSYLVYHIPPALHNHLLDQYVWSTKELTILFYKPMERVPEFLFGLQNYIDPDPHTIRETVLKIFLGNDVLDRIQAMVRENPEFAHMNHYAASLSILHSLRVVIVDTKLPGDKSAPIANILMRPATHDREAFITFRTHLLTLNYRSSFLGPGAIHDGWRCTGCHSFDHPRGLCPLPLIAGWNGPAPTTSLANSAPSNMFSTVEAPQSSSAARRNQLLTGRDGPILARRGNGRGGRGNSSRQQERNRT